MREARPSGKKTLQAMMDRAVNKQRFSSFSRPTIQQSLSFLKSPRKPVIIREATILGKLSALTNFDNLGMRNQTNKYYAKLNAVFVKYGEGNLKSNQIFTDQIMQIDSKMNRTKRFLVVTEKALYCLRENFSTKLRMDLKNITKVFLIKSNSSVMALS